MAKKRKTREEKKLADLRHSFTKTIAEKPVFTIQTNALPTPSLKSETKNTKSDSKENYPFLAKDLSKTAIVTTGILAFQVILYFILTHHMIRIPGLIY